MLNRHIINTDFKSKFKILKESKISLVVSALFISGTLISPANAADTVISTAETAQQAIGTSAYVGLEVTSAGSITYDANTTDPGAVINSGNYIAASITNDGTISSENTGAGHAAAISIQASAANQTSMSGTAKIENNAIMSATASNGSASTIDILGWTQSGTEIKNNGTMTATATTDARGIHLAGSLAGNITNSSTGTITANGVASASAIEINFVGEGIKSTGSLSNAGTLNATAATLANGMKITGSVTANGTIENSGTINVDATNGHARGIEVLGAMNGSIVNDGTIDVEALGDAYGILLQTTNGTGSVTNNGDILVNGGTDGGATREAYGFKTSKAITGGVTNTGTIKATINSEYDQQGYSLYMRFNEAFTNEASGKLYGNIAAYLNTGNVINKGLVSLPYNVNGRSSSADADGVANLANFNQHATGTLEIGLLTDGTTTTYSKFVVGNDATFADGSTIGVNVLAASTNSELLMGTTLDDVVTAGNLTIDGTLQVTDNSALLDFEYVKDGETIDLTVVGANSEEEDENLLKSVIKGKGNKNTQTATKAISKIPSVTTELNKLPTDAAVAKAVESTTPLTATASAGAGTQIMSGMNNIVEMRQNVNVGLNSGDPLMADKNVWVKPYFSLGEQNDKDGFNGFDVNTQGLAIGIDGEYDTNKRVGLAVFYTQAQVDVNNVSQSSDLDVFNALVYGNIPLFDSRTNFLYQIGYGIQKTSSSRRIDSALGGGNANADYKSTTASLDLKLMGNYQVSNDILLQPIVQATYRRFSNPSYSESGATDANLNIHADSFSTNELIGTVGTLARYKIDQDSSILGNLNVGYDFKNEQATVTSAYQGDLGTTFDTKGIDNGKWNYQVGIGYEIKNILGGELNFMYNYQAKGSDFSNNTFSSKYVLKF